MAPAEVLETAAGTGVLTRELGGRLPDATIVATDLNDHMMATAREQPGLDGVRWQQADALVALRRRHVRRRGVPVRGDVLP